MYIYGPFAGTEVSSYRAAIRTARGVVQDIGEHAASSSGGLVQLSKVSESHSERDGQKIIAKKFKLAIPVDIVDLPKTPGMRYTGNFSVISLKSWAQYIVNMGCWNMLVGLSKSDPQREQDLLRTFWSRYQKLFPTHTVFDTIAKEQIDVSRLAPLLFHGDEGRGRKRSGLLVLSYHAMLGKGTQASREERKGKKRPYLNFNLNYIGSTHSTRFITGVLPKMVKDHVACDALFKFVVDDSLAMFHQGVQNREGTTYRMVVLSVSGDWQFLVKAGGLTRSYSNVEKRPRGVNSNPRGICHLCRGGQLNVPWEDFGFTHKPLWRQTQFQDDPFQPGNVSHFVRWPHQPGKTPAIFCFDLWHCYHLGAGKVFLASCLSLISDRMASSNIQDRFEELTEQYLSFCERMHKAPFLTQLTKENLGWQDRSSYPNGQWSKGHVTTLLGEFVEDWCSRNDISDSPMLQQCARANAAIGRCMRKMYAAGLFLTTNDAVEISSAALLFLREYQQLATSAYNQSLSLFSYMPKHHALSEIFWDLKEAAETEGIQFCLNPLIWAVQISEDYIGKTSRTSRKCSAQQVILRTLQRCLQATYKHWCDCGYIRQ